VTDLTPAQRAARLAAGQARFRLTEERFARVVELVRIGNFAGVAAAAAGLSERSFRKYMAAGRDVEEKVAARCGEDHGFDETRLEPPDGVDVSANEWTCWRLFHAISKASAEAEAYAVAIVRQAMPETVESAQWFLERGRSRRWKRRDAHELDVVDARGAEEDQDLLDPEASALMHEALAVAARQSRGALPPAPKPPDVEGTARDVEHVRVDDDAALDGDDAA
jgi:hypothetical protein